MKIGFFDSGLGGLIILKATRDLLPEYDYLYFGDTANLPYGDKTEEEIYDFTSTAVKKLFDEGAMLVIVACNTASAESVRKLQDTILVGKYADRKVLGVIIPTVETVAMSRHKKVLLIGTRRTIASRKYERELEKLFSNVKLTSHATPKLVPLIEEGKLSRAMTELEIAIKDSVGQEIDAIVLGCTHYAMLKEELREFYKMDIISQDEIIPKKIKTYLEKHTEIESKLSRGGTAKITLSGDDTEHYEKFRNQLGDIQTKK